MKVSDVIKLPVRIDNAYWPEIRSPYDKDGRISFSLDVDGIDKKEREIIAHCLNTYDTRTDLIRRMVQVLDRMTIEGCDCEICSVAAEAKKELE